MGNSMSCGDNALLAHVATQNQLLREMIERRDEALHKLTAAVCDQTASLSHGKAAIASSAPALAEEKSDGSGGGASAEELTASRLRALEQRASVLMCPSPRSGKRASVELRTRLVRDDFYGKLHSQIHTKLLFEKYSREDIAKWRQQANLVSSWVTDQKVMEMARTDWNDKFERLRAGLRERGQLSPVRERWLFAVQYCYAVMKLPPNRIVYNKFLASCYMPTYNSLHSSSYPRNVKMALMRIYKGDDARYSDMASATLFYTKSKGDTVPMEVGHKLHIQIYCGRNGEFSPTTTGLIEEIDYEKRRLSVNMAGGAATMAFQLPIVSDPHRRDADVEGCWMVHGSPAETGDGLYAIKAVGADNVLTFYEHLQGNLKECCGLDKAPRFPPCRDLRLINLKMIVEEDANGEQMLVDYGHFTHERDENDENPKITGCYRIRWTIDPATRGPSRMISLQIFKTCA